MTEAELVGGSKDGVILTLHEDLEEIVIETTRMIPDEVRIGYVGGDHRFRAVSEKKAIDPTTGERIPGVDPTDPARSTCRVCGHPYEDHALAEKPVGETRSIGERLAAGEPIPAEEFAGWPRGATPETTVEEYGFIGERQGRRVYALRKAD